MNIGMILRKWAVGAAVAGPMLLGPGLGSVEAQVGRHDRAGAPARGPARQGGEAGGQQQGDARLRDLFRNLGADRQGPAAPNPTPRPDGPVVEQGQELTGVLGQGDRKFSTGEYYQEHTVRLGAGQAVRFRLLSEAFDPYLVVRTPSGEELINDDYGDGDRSAGIDLPRTEGGEYTILVTSFEAGETGPWRLRIELGPGQPAIEMIPGPGMTRNGAGGRVFAVLVGITDYPSSPDELPGCADDAVRLSQTLAQQGLLTPDRQVVLTDARATRANVCEALERMARLVGPDDVLIFFYSGHGGNTPTGDDREIDGTDEYLVLFDEPLLDDELGLLLDRIGARLSVVALDACYAGGFARDVITRPGRIGLFSSEEDVSSDIAPAFQAGGYLAHFLLTGLAGDADAGPGDGVLTVGELTHYLTLQFGRSVTDVRTDEGYQHLVIDRGAVSVDEILWAPIGAENPGGAIHRSVADRK